MNCKAVIFDLDGVLVDTAQYHFMAWKALAEELQIPFSREDNQALKGVSRMASLEIILKLGKRQDIPEYEKNRLANHKNMLYLKYIEAMDPQEALLPGALETLEAFRSRGIQTALGSASKNARLIVERCGLSPLLDSVVDGNQVQHAKPDPEVFLLAAKKLKTPAVECLVFEDAPAGVEAAGNAGMYCIAIGNPEDFPAVNPVIKDLAHFQMDLLNTL